MDEGEELARRFDEAIKHEVNRNRDERIRDPGDEFMPTTDRENDLVDALMTEGPWPVYGRKDLITALRIGYQLGQIEK